MTDHDIQEFDEYKDKYESEIGDSLAFAGQEHDFYIKMKADHLLGMIKEHFGATKQITVLDVGCGHGLMHRHMMKPFVKVFGCDPAATVIEEAKVMNPGVEYEANDGNTLPYADNSFDVSNAVCVMHHVPPEQWPAFLEEMRRVTKPGGFISIYEHNPLNPVTRHIVNNCPLDENAVLLKSGTMRRLMRDAQLPRVNTQFIAFFPLKGGLFRAIERLLGWLPLGAQYVARAEVD